MRNNWEEVRISSLPGNASLSQSQHVEDEKRLYDFGTDRPISAPPPSGMGFDVSNSLLIAFMYHRYRFHFTVTRMTNINVNSEDSSGARGIFVWDVGR